MILIDAIVNCCYALRYSIECGIESWIEWIVLILLTACLKCLY